ncbi:MAG: stage II sporulation protein D [Ruminococcus sp.]|nr:stage II sporulation protein D [Ruminococcus sp.]
MKSFVSFAFFLVATTAVPAVPVLIAPKSDVPVSVSDSVPDSVSDSENITLREFVFKESSDKPYLVLDCETGQIDEVSVRDYVIGAVAAEMPASFEPEALKAQAVAAHTYAERQRNIQNENPDSALGNADFSDDPNKYQAFFTNEQIRQYFGDNYRTHYEKISSAVDDVLDYILVYDDEPIIAAFHSMSSGITESAENVWGTAVDYLIPVDSKSDISAPRYTDEVKITESFFKSRLEKVFDGVNLGDDPHKWIEIVDVSDSGTVLTAKAGDITVTGSEIRDAFGLRSADFEISFDGNDVVFTTHGFGHGVGMSQYGANSMALEGKNWKQILAHYYPNADLVSIE